MLRSCHNLTLQSQKFGKGHKMAVKSADKLVASFTDEKLLIFGAEGRT